MIRSAAIVMLAAVLGASGAFAQSTLGPPLPEVSTPSQQVAPFAPLLGDAITVQEPAKAAPFSRGINPLDVLEGAASAIPGSKSSSTSGGKPGLSSVVNILVLLTIVSLAPSIMLMTTCFVRILIVLGLLRQALGTSSVPPPQVITALAMFMTLLVMSPTLDRIHREAIVPYQSGEVADYDDLWDRAKQPVRDFMFAQIETTGNWSSLYMVMEYRGIDVASPEKLTRADVDMISLVPAYMLSELKAAFLMGFRIYLPFLVIDMVISTMLIAMSMMMLPPVLISLPFKLLLFVLVDGWTLVVGGLLNSFRQPADEVQSAGVAVLMAWFALGMMVRRRTHRKPAHG